MTHHHLQPGSVYRRRSAPHPDEWWRALIAGEHFPTKELVSLGPFLVLGVESQQLNKPTVLWVVASDAAVRRVYVLPMDISETLLPEKTRETL